MLKLINIILLVITLLPINLKSQSISSDSLNVEKYKRHVSSLDYISRQTDSNPFFLNLAKEYCDSILNIDSENTYAINFKNKINLTLATCDQNMNHKVELFPFFNGFPDYMGFADDPIEYAYDDAINKLFSSKYIKLHNGPIKDANITSIIVRDNCDDEMFEIVNQIIIKNTNHYVLPPHEIEELIGAEETTRLINGDVSSEIILKLSNKLNLDRLGIFRVNDLDVINNKIWLVNSEFYTYYDTKGFSEPIFTRGYNFDKRNISASKILLMLLQSILLIAFISFLNQNLKRSISSSDNVFKDLVGIYFKKIKFILKCFPIPLVFSFLMIYSLSYLMPNPEDHYLEFSAKLWIFLLTIGMSIIPTIINLYFINRLDLDGFHTIKGYRYFANTSLYATYFPLFVFYLIQYETSFNIAHLLLIVITLIVGDLLAKSYFQFSAITKNPSLKVQSFIGLIFGIIALLIFNILILSNLSIENLLWSILIISPISLAHYIIGILLNKKYELDIQSSSEQHLLSEIPFIKSVIDPEISIYKKVDISMSDKELNVMILSGPSGIGKTRSLMEVKSNFELQQWEWFYGDCDEIQGETAISFEPFLEAFKRLLKIDEFTNRGEQMESTMGSAVNMGAAIIDVDTSAFVKDYERDGSQKMTEVCIEIIDELEKRNKKTIFVMEDLHWIDPESYSFLKLFVQMINRNKFLRGNMCIILSIRNDSKLSYRGPSIDQLKKDISLLQESSSFPFSVEPLLGVESFNLSNFVKSLSTEDNSFKIQNNSMVNINDVFNQAIDEYVVEYITPLYITKVLEKWIDDEVLIYTPEGYKLTTTISSQELPNETGVDSYYHNIIDKYDDKWKRLLESAAIIGNKFNADILASVWNYELLDVLSFLENAVEDKLLIDVSNEDNIYKFGEKDKVGSGKRIVSSIKSYFYSYETDDSEKQITIEYNKRYISLQSHILENSTDYSTEELLNILRRLCSLLMNDDYKKKAEHLIFEIVVRLVYSREVDKLSSVISFLKKYSVLDEVVKILKYIRYFSDEDSNQDLQKDYESELKKYIYEKDSILNDLRLFALLPLETKALSIFNNLNRTELSLLNIKINNYSNGLVKTYLGILFSRVKFRKTNDPEFESRLSYLESLNKQIINHADNVLYKLLIEYEIFSTNYSLLRHSKKDVDRKLLDEKSKELIVNFKKHSQLSHLMTDIYYYRFRVLNVALRDYEKSIVEFRELLVLVENKSKNLSWAKSVLEFLTDWSAEIYYKKHPKEALEIINLCQKIIYKYIDQNSFTKINDLLIGAKIKYFMSVNDFKSALKIALNMNSIIENSLGVINRFYEYSCNDIGKIHEELENGKLAIEWKLKAIDSRESRYKKAKNPDLKGNLATAYNNISHVYRNFMNDPENCLKYAKLALEFKEADSSNSYGISLYMLGRAYDFNKQYKEAVEYYTSANKLFPAETNKDIYQRAVLNINLGITLSFVDKDKSKKLLIENLSIFKKKDISEYITTPIKNRINEAEAILITLSK
jgi:hypothetical protein